MSSFKTAITQIRRSPYQAFSAIFILSLNFFIASIFALVALGSDQIIRHFETRPQVIAYLKDDASQDAIQNLNNTLSNLTDVNNVKFVSKAEALAIYKESVGNDPLLLGTITELGEITQDILPASIEVSVSNPDSFNSIISTLKQSDVVSTNAAGEKEIDFPQDVFSELTRWTKALRLSGLVLIIAQVISSVLTMMIIIGIKIRSRLFEIRTMRLLGANGLFIIKPYLIEASLYAVIGSLFGWIISYTTLLYATPFLASRLSGIIPLPVPPLFMLLFLAALIFASLVLGLISALLAAIRFVRS